MPIGIERENDKIFQIIQLKLYFLRKEKVNSMNETLKKIYEEVASKEDEAIKVLMDVDEEIKKIAEEYESKLDHEELETLQDLLFSAALAGEQAGFEIGMKFAIQMLKSE